MNYEEWYAKNDIVYESEYKDYKIIIVSFDTWATYNCAYVIFPEKHKHLLEYDFEYDSNDLISVHGGITFQADWGIGWDYVHHDDLDKDYPIDYIVDEARSVIDQLVKLANKQEDK